MTRWELLIFLPSPRRYVVTAYPEGHPWTHAERTSPNWAIVRVPLLEIEVAALKEPKARPEGGFLFEARVKTLNPLMLPALAPGQVLDVPRDRFLAAVQ